MGSLSIIACFSALPSVLMLSHKVLPMSFQCHNANITTGKDASLQVIFLSMERRRHLNHVCI